MSAHIDLLNNTEVYKTNFSSGRAISTSLVARIIPRSAPEFVFEHVSNNCYETMLLVDVLWDFCKDPVKEIEEARKGV